MKEKIALVLNVIQTLALILILVVLVTNRKEPKPNQVTAQLEAHYKNPEPVKLTDTDAIWGNKDAPTTVVAFVDYQCPYCKDLYKNLKEIEKDYIETGKVKVIFRDLPLKMHEHSRELATLVECARQQGKFWQMADLILSPKEKYDSTQLIQWEGQLGLNPEEMATCMNDKKTLDAVLADIKDAKSRKLTGTPAVFINDVFYRGTIPASDLKAIFDGKKVARRTQKSGACGQK